MVKAVPSRELLVPEVQDFFTEIAGSNRNRRPPKMVSRVDRYLKNNVVASESRRVIKEVAEKIDEERNRERAWLLVDDVTKTGYFNRVTGWNEIYRGASFNAHRSTVAYIRNSEIASGVLVEIANRTFIATTAHTLLKNTRDIFLVGFEDSESSVPVLNFGRGHENTIDVAYVEVSNDQAQRLKKEPIELDRIGIFGCGKKDQHTIVMGCPAQLVRHERHKNVTDLIVRAQTWTFPVLEPDEWHYLEDSETRGAPDPKRDVFIAYVQDQDIEVLPPESTSDKRVAIPKGMSGGGYWMLEKREDKLWFPQSYKLFAIQSRWWNLGDYLQGVQIVYWLALVWLGQPELREVIENKFPDIDFEEHANLFGEDVWFKE